MRYLLDTHTFYWCDHDPAKLSAAVAAVLLDPANDVFISTINIWEVVVKSALNKLSLQNPIDRLVEEQCRVNGFRLLAVEGELFLHVLRQVLELHFADTILMLEAQTVGLHLENDGGLEFCAVLECEVLEFDFFLGRGGTGEGGKAEEKRQCFHEWCGGLPGQFRGQSSLGRRNGKSHSPLIQEIFPGRPSQASPGAPSLSVDAPERGPQVTVQPNNQHQP